MSSLSARGRVVVMSSLVAAWTVLGFACSVEDENPATTRARGVDSGSDGTASADGAVDLPVDPAVCGKLGNIEGVKGVAQQIINAAKSDCRISELVSDAQAIDVAHFEECFAAFLGGGVRCPGITYEDNKTTDSKGKICKQILPGLKFSSMDYKAFADFNAKAPVAVVKGVMDSKGLSVDDYRAIASLFEGKKASLLSGNNNGVPLNKYTSCAPNCPSGGEACILIVDAGNDTGPKDTGAPDAADAADQ